MAIVSVYLVETFVQSHFFETIAISNPISLTTGQWIGNLTLSETWRWHLTRGVENCFLGPFWTLCYEEQFYLVVGLVLLFARRFFFGAFAAVSIAVLAGFFQTAVDTNGWFFDGRWLMFASGILVYYVLNHVRSANRVWYCIPLGIGVICALANPRQLLLQQVNEPNQSYLAAFCFALLLIVLHPWDDRLSRLRWLHPLRFCGERCYSLYLVHWPLATVVMWALSRWGFHHPLAILFLVVPCCVGAVVVVGEIFHVLIERRFWNPRYLVNAARQPTDGKPGAYQKEGTKP